jgi:Protein of unknown function (DUF4238)
MKHVRNQHIVPEFLLKNFSDDSKIWSFDKYAIRERWGNQKSRPISKVPTKEYFYDKVIGEKVDSFEYILRDIETKAAPIIVDLVEKKDISSLSEIDKDVIADFLSFQMLRTKRELSGIEDFLNNLCSPIEELTRQPIERNNRIFWLGLLERAKAYRLHLRNKTWILAESNSEFYLSDNPVVLQNIIHAREHRGNLGLESLGIEIYLPLSCSVVLGLFCSRTIATQISTIKGNKKEYPFLPQILKCGAKTIENLNWLQIINSDRFVFSKNGNFDLVNKMILENASQVVVGSLS